MRINENMVRCQYGLLTQLLIEKKLTITTMESITSGQIASLITDTPGSSAVFKGAFVTYSNEAKIMQGVPKEIIDTYSVYSEETALHMALACQKVYNADIAIGVTGTAGNVDEANTEHSKKGEIFFAIYFKGDISTYKIKLLPCESRLEYKLTIAKEICDNIFRLTVYSGI